MDMTRLGSFEKADVDLAHAVHRILVEPHQTNIHPGQGQLIVTTRRRF